VKSRRPDLESRIPVPRARKGRLLAVSISEKKGTRKRPIPVGVLREDHGLVGDAHAGTGRQVSLLANESVDTMRAEGLELHPGDFGENLTVVGIEVHRLPIGARLRVGSSAMLAVTEIGKECHEECEIRAQAGRCVMPTEGIFARVVAGGEVRAGDEVLVLGSEEASLLPGVAEVVEPAGGDK
jgi:MOSC domain-containing protein YiiM